MKWFFSLFSLFILFILPTYADESVNSWWLADTFCTKENFGIEGDSEVIINNWAEYKISVWSGSLEESQVSFELLRWGKEVDTKPGFSYIRIFTQPWVVTLKANIKTDTCTQSITKNIHIYKSLSVFIWTPGSFLDNDFTELLKKKDILFTVIKLPKTGLNLGSQDMFQILLKQWKDLEKASVLYIENERSLSILDGLSRLEKSVLWPKKWSQVQMYIISSTRFSLLSKIIAPYINKLSVKKIGVIDPENFLDFVVKKSNSEVTQTNFISFEKETRYFFSLNTLVQYLTYYGLDYSIIWILLSVSFTLLILNFCKQVIGMNVFWIYYPLLLALCLSIMDVWFVAIFIIISLLAIGGSILLSRLITLLYLSKRSVIISLYIILSLIFLWIDSYFSFGFIQLDWFSNKAILVMLIVFILVSDKIFHEDIPLFSKRGLQYAGEFILIVSICFLFLNSSLIQIILLSFPDIIFLLFVGNFIVGQYTGLQMVEYIRFFPIIKKLQEEEE
jgi:hypothetical protein